MGKNEIIKVAKEIQVLLNTLINELENSGQTPIKGWVRRMYSEEKITTIKDHVICNELIKGQFPEIKCALNLIINSINSQNWHKTKNQGRTNQKCKKLN